MGFVNALANKEAFGNAVATSDTTAKQQTVKAFANRTCKSIVDFSKRRALGGRICPDCDRARQAVLRRTRDKTAGIKECPTTRDHHPSYSDFIWLLGNKIFDPDDLINETKNGEEKAKKAIVDAARLADELRAEQEHAQTQEKQRKTLELQVKELQVRLDESENNALNAEELAQVGVSHQENDEMAVPDIFQRDRPNALREARECVDETELDEIKAVTPIRGK
ncbi:hypothetical protein OUZ56_020659 [Daphnia magna]|uniref:Uncharacterized protein n=1 Tax=Daphnia magna TaxID=35525 RepID=A0ABQ9ZF31_9CRUS|nr:hypothetical protein OUZ56_020659 [Daphnia magna]